MNSKQSSHPLRYRAAFTLVELLVSLTLISAVMVLLLSTVDSTQRLWIRTTAKASQFQAARAAFESMNRRIGQATLNAYWKAYQAELQAAQAGLTFRRVSELHFLAGPTGKIMGNPELASLAQPLERGYPGHSVFFQAPIGYTEELEGGGGRDASLRKYRALDGAISACGYFVEYGVDPIRPPFLEQAKLPERHRFRLMELNVPTERMNLYKRLASLEETDPKLKPLLQNEPQWFDETGSKGSYYVGLVDEKREEVESWIRPLWMKEALTRERPSGGGANMAFRYGRVMAENVVTMILLPKLAENDRRNTAGALDRDALLLAPDYQYDSWRVVKKDQTHGLKNSAREHLLPPIIQVTLVAIDEPSAVRMASDAANIPTWTEGLFEHVTKEADYLRDIEELTKRLREEPSRPNFRIFTADVLIRGSKWSADVKDN